ncbi:TIM-barrel domain-containing protein [Polyangium aurulentum]|uniref:glycoside hydrolase family 31 protein n=1 Tax=Polyangium aurulentum TaxID=2567896 RepID=UPI0010AE4918|nr:TIM-barrel domain-containing protein [Polyangium aurulentum]UQA60674.1 alpha-glucosidase [Polyangium aurulentum]
MDLTDASIEPARVHLWGARSALEIRCPFPGVLRIRHAPSSAAATLTHPELAPKQSWAVVADGATPISARRDGDLLRITAPSARIEIALPTGAWTFFDETGETPLARCEAISGATRAAFPMDRHEARISLHAPPGEAYLGFGEKVGTLDKRGQHFTFWNTDNFPPGVDTDPLYASIPFFLAMREGIAWGFFLDEPWRSEVDVASADPTRIAWETSGPELDVYLIVGPHPADVLRRYAALTGRPAMPPLWSLGAHQSRWGYERASDLREVVRGYRERGLPLDVVHLDIDHMEAYKAWTWDRARFPDPAALARELSAEGVKVVTIVDPSIKVEPGYPVYEEARARGYLVRLDRGDPLVGEVWADPAVFPDFTREEVRRFWADLHAPHFESGVAGIWNDMNEPSCFSIRDARGVPAAKGERPSGIGTLDGRTLPFEAWHGDRRHLEMHNVYGLAMARATVEGFERHAPGRRPFVLTRAAFAGIQRFAAVWTGDFGSHFTHLEASIPMLIGLGLSGVPFVGADIPGFVGRADGELFTRWMQAGLFYPLMRNHGARGAPPREPWRFGEPVLSLARAILERRYRLLPALYTAMREAAESGLPVMRPVAFVDPSDPEALRAFDQLLFGEHLLVAPVVRPGQTKRLAYLPAGKWLEFSNLEPRGGVIEGRRHVIADAPLDVVPVWLREGAALPLGAPRAHTTTANWPEITWHVHAAAAVNGRLYEDEGDGNGPSRMTEIRGGTSGATFILERHATGALPLSRASETLCIHGLPPPRAVSGAFGHRVAAGSIELHVDAAWERVELSF